MTREFRYPSTGRRGLVAYDQYHLPLSLSWPHNARSVDIILPEANGYYALNSNFTLLNK